MSEAIFKFNNGNLAILCSGCRAIIKTGVDFTDEETKACRGERPLTAQYCENCKADKKKDEIS